MELEKMNVNVWNCPLCNINFTRKSSLVRHDKSIHSRSKNFFKCGECNKSFKRADTLKQHFVTHQADQPVFECWHCSKKFHYRNNVITHINVMHSLSDRRLFECAYCSKTFRHKGSLRKHIFLLHQFQFDLDGNHTISNNIFECEYCCATFNLKYSLDRHIHSAHLIPKQKKCHLRCLKCAEVFCHSRWLNKHYVQIHGVLFTYENLEFDSIESYNQWLEEEQHQTITQYPLWYKKKFISHTIEHRICHRSRDYHSKLNMDSRKRCLKVNGYKKLGGICPAYIRARIENSGKCFVLFQKTHVGHNIRDRSELGLIYTSKTEKTIIAAKIRSGIPLAEIVNQGRISGFSNGDISRLALLNRKDVHNIAASCNIAISRESKFEDCDLVPPASDTIDDDAKITAHEDDILFYKKQNEEDLRFNVLQKEDFVFIVMTKNQEMYLRTYGHKVICLDSTQDTNPYGFLLRTLLILDADCQGLPGAFLLTNRDDQDVIDVFLTCIRDRIGIVETQTFISDLQIMYYSSWVRIMEPPKQFIFCTWHVQEDWRKNCNKITNKKKRNAVRKELKCLLHELDPIKFETNLNSFLSYEDDDLTKFQDYFRNDYTDNTSQWAYCYQSVANINTNRHLESFYRTYKHFISGGEEVTSLTQCFDYIFHILNSLEITITEKKIRGKVTRKLSILRNRHRVALAEYDKDALSKVIVIDNDTFFIQSFEKGDIFYTVTKKEVKECMFGKEPCEFICDLCSLCVHTFQCNCEDSLITSNMCKHIHLVGLYLKHQQPSESDAVTLDSVCNAADTENTNAEVVYIESGNVPPNTKHSNSDTHNEYETDSLAKCRQKIDGAIKNLIAVKMTSTEREMNYIYENYLCHIPAALDVFKMPTPAHSNVTTTSGSGKIKSPKRTFAKKKAD